MNRWEPRDGGMYCVTHERLFPKKKTCGDCDLNPGAAPTTEHVADIDKELRLREEEFRTEAKFLRRIGRELIDNKGRDAATGVKFYDTAIKYERASLEIRNRILDREHDRWLVEQNRLLQGGASH